MTTATRMLPTKAQIKQNARTLRARRMAAGHPMRHAQALERISRKLGYRDWNTLSAAITTIRDRSCLPERDSVQGRYMGHPFDARILKVGVDAEGRTRLVLRLQTAIDVVEHGSFTALRQQIACNVDETGRSQEVLSDGTPHVALML